MKHQTVFFLLDVMAVLCLMLTLFLACRDSVTEVERILAVQRNYYAVLKVRRTNLPWLQVCWVRG